jgi:hypothetical protein
MVLEHDHHVHPAQQFVQHDALVDALALAMAIARGRGVMCRGIDCGICSIGFSYVYCRIYLIL